ncbi:MAG: hypothetical protein AAF297_08485 [Planctomycetota bacterium]
MLDAKSPIGVRWVYGLALAVCSAGQAEAAVPVSGVGSGVGPAVGSARSTSSVEAGSISIEPRPVGALELDGLGLTGLGLAGSGVGGSGLGGDRAGGVFAGAAGIGPGLVSENAVVPTPGAGLLVVVGAGLLMRRRVGLRPSRAASLQPSGEVVLRRGDAAGRVSTGAVAVA